VIDLWRPAATITEWKDSQQERTPEVIGLRVCEVTKACGKAVAAWVSLRTKDPRVVGGYISDETVDELANVAIAAMVAITSMDHDVEAVLRRQFQVIMADIG
jgi:hypothetical protein